MQLNNLKQNRLRFIGIFLALVVFALYLSTMAQGLILGDPTEYTIASHVLGIAHPPGYAIMTILGKLAQTIIPIGSIAWRSHLLNGIVGTIVVVAIYNIVLLLTNKNIWGVTAAIFAAVSVAWAPNHWQHSIHANPHLITATFLIVNIWLLIRWEYGNKIENKRKEASDSLSTPHLLLFSLLTGIGAVHHPLTVFSFPAYALFILMVYPRILLDWKLLLKMVSLAFLGLSLFAYYPIISSQSPLMGPNSMNTLNGFLDHVLARGLSDSLPYYSLAEQPIRLIVFGSILRLQYGLIGIALAILGGLSPVFTPRTRKDALLIVGALFINYAFVISLKQQDIMAYIMGPNLLIALLIGIGCYSILTFLNHQPKTSIAFLVFTVLLGPFFSLGTTLPYVSLRSFSEGDDHVKNTFEQFEGQGEGVVLLNNWEFMTPLWYAQLVENRWPDPADVRPVFVSAADPWLPSVFNYLPGGPVYLNGYRREIVEAGFRLRPRGDFYQVVEPGDTSIPNELTRVNAKGNGPELVGYQLEKNVVTSGDYVSLRLAMRLDKTTTDFFAPIVTLASTDGKIKLDLPFTTDSHLVTPLWEPGEVIVEKYDFAIPHNFPAGEYLFSIEINNLSQDRDSGFKADLDNINVQVADRNLPNSQKLLANFRHRVGLVGLTARSGLQRRQAPWSSPLVVERGDTVIVAPKWEAIDFAEESYTIFVHLIDGANVSYANLDYTPLGGAVPTHLWFPKWLPGQRMTDPYRLVIPENISPGTYQIEVGIYEMTSRRRLAMHDLEGNQIGDRYIAGSIEVR